MLKYLSRLTHRASFFPALMLSLILTTYSLNGYAGASFDHTFFDHLLGTFVNENGEVDFQGIHQNPGLLKSYLDELAAIQKTDLESDAWTREDRLALWLNAYHAGVLDLLQAQYRLQRGLQDIRGGWDIKAVNVAGKQYSLNEIRAGKLIGYFRDEKIHLALACGSRSCPAFPREAYDSSKVEGQLFQATKTFVNDPKRNEIVVGDNKVKLAKTFKWYGSDFQLDFGVYENDRGLSQTEFAVLSFVIHYLDDQDKINYLEEGKYKVKYLPFDWSLNEWKK